MLFSIEQAFVGREEIRAPQKMPAWEATPPQPGIYRVPPRFFMWYSHWGNHKQKPKLASMYFLTFSAWCGGIHGMFTDLVPIIIIMIIIIMIWRQHIHKVVLCPPDSWSNWNLEILVFEERGKPEYLEKRREPTIMSV